MQCVTEIERLQSGAEDAGIHFGEKQGDATSIRGQDLAMLVVEAHDDSFADQASEVVAHLVRCVGRAEQRGD